MVLFFALIFNLQAQAAFKCSEVFAAGRFVTVHKSQDAEAYFCEHAYCIGIKSAINNPNIAKDKQGDKLVGFLHIQQDQYQASKRVSYFQLVRHEKTRFLVGLAIKGYFNSLLKVWPEQNSYKVLITGFDKFNKFMSVVNNPTKDFVSHEENIDAALRIAFGNRQSKIDSPTNDLQYLVKINDREEKTLIFKREILSVNSRGLNKLSRLVSDFNPNAIISMGVTDRYAVETRATDIGLAVSSSGYSRKQNRPATVHYENGSLWNAITEDFSNTESLIYLPY